MKRLDPWMLDLAAVALRRRTGLTYSAARRDALEEGLLRLMDRHGVATPVGLLARADEDEGLFDELVAELTVGETYFLRDAAQFDLLRVTALPDLLERRRGLRVWSAGCATGAEAYSLAILLHEAAPGLPHHVLGTDLSRHALTRARGGRYTPWALRAVPDAVRERYFRRVGDGWEVVDPLRRMVDFRYLNLAEDCYPSLATGTNGLDLILCRNVLIYLDEAYGRRVAAGLLASLQPDGWLLLGAADPPLQHWVDCETFVTDAGVVYRRKRLSGVPDEEPVSGTAGAVAEPLKATSAPTAADWYACHDYARAASAAASLVRADGADAADWVLLVRAHANAGVLDVAAEVCTEGIARHPLDPELNYLQSVLLLEMHRNREAAAAARRALYADPAYVMAHLTLTDALARAGDGDGARQALGNAAHLLTGMVPDTEVPGADGESVARIAAMVRARLAVLQGAAA